MDRREKRSYSPKTQRGVSGACVDTRDVLETRAGRSSVLAVQLERRKGLEREDKLLFAFQKGTASGEEQGREVSFYSSSPKHGVSERIR